MKKSTRKKAPQRSPDVPQWMKKAWKAAEAKPQSKLTMRDVDVIISEVRAERNAADYHPVKLTISLTKGEAAWLKRQATKFHCSIEELIMHGVAVYAHDPHHLAEDREYFTKAIAESTDKLKTGRYES